MRMDENIGTHDLADAPASGSCVDAARLRDLQQSLDDGVFEVISTYLEESPRLLADLRRSCAANDWPETQRVAHSLKSSSGIFGAQKLTALCRELEVLAAAAAELPQEQPAAELPEELPGEQPARCTRMIEQITEEYARVAAALAAYQSHEAGRE